MKPCLRNAQHSSNFLVGNYNTNFGFDNTVRSIAGSVDKQGVDYSNAQVLIARKSDFQPIAVRKPDAAGHYSIDGLNADVLCFVIAFDQNEQDNAVIQDNVVPK
ncbi:hypothetical protein [Alkanindiges illinoisensis]|uniref:hypothetical protein n=1 Tax=Alkanindiges illinoisensis TaxID=197183 RepID=UPI00047AC6C4|nr:hypothetical protein [Alkanindiges illinoisensis]